MRWLIELSVTDPVAHALGVLALVCVAGMAIGSVNVRGVRLGTAGVLFAGILTGHFGKPVSKQTLDFVREFGLILFVFTIGLQLGPGFFAALRQQGVRMNALAALIVILGAVAAPVAGRLAHFDPAASLGIFSGASVNMPSLGAATQTLSGLAGISPDRVALPALACAVTFPVAILASIGSLLALKSIYRIDSVHEAEEFATKNRRDAEPLERRTLIVKNPELDGQRLDSLPQRGETEVTIARLRHGGEIQAATDSTLVHVDDYISVVGTRKDLDQFEGIVGQRSDLDLVLSESGVTSRLVVVTNGEVLGRTIGEINLDDRFGVAVTRTTRADIEMTAIPGLRLQFGDRLSIVGRGSDLDRAAKVLGDSIKELNETHFIPMFIGIALGIAAGTMPIAFPGLPQPVRLGLAGGPLIVALILGRIGRIGKLACYMPANANLAFREFGIALFFAAVGLDAGAAFFRTVFSETGMQWLIAGIAVATLPLLIVGTIARTLLRMNFVELSGLIAGSTTNPPALAFATSLSQSDTPTLTYATVYPLTMLLRIFSAQVLALTIVR